MSACEIGANSAETMERRPRISQRSCIKCKESKGNLLVRNVVYCKLCLLALVRQRFRKSIDEAIQHDDHAPRVLTIAYSGGLGSTVLLDLAMQELFPENARKSRRHRWSNVFVIYVDHSSVSTSDGDTRSDILRVISKYRLAHPIVVPLEEAFGPKEDPNSVKQLKAYLEALPTKTATSASLQLLTRRLLERAAQSCGASHLLLGRSLSGLSMALISSICQGSGFSIAEERQSVTDGLLSVNPLKDLGSKECGAWVWWNGLQVVSNLIRDTQINGGSSISALTRDFISGLEKDYPSTVSTIVKTCGKVVAKDSKPSLCSLCCRQKQESWSPVSFSDVNDSREIFQAFCYACNTMLTSGNSKTTNQENSSLPLPVWVNSTL